MTPHAASESADKPEAADMPGAADKPEPIVLPEPIHKPAAAKPRARRRWFQFSLRALFVGVTVIGVLLAVGLRWIAPAQRQRAAVQMVERLEGFVVYADAEADEGWLTTWL